MRGAAGAHVGDGAVRAGHFYISGRLLPFERKEQAAARAARSGSSCYSSSSSAHRFSLLFGLLSGVAGCDYHTLFVASI